jgi:hypothetical protein
VVTSTPIGNGASSSLEFIATLNISPTVPAPNGNLTWTITGAAAACSSATPLTLQGGGTYSATCTINNSHNNTYNATANFGSDTYYITADASLNGVKG